MRRPIRLLGYAVFLVVIVLGSLEAALRIFWPAPFFERVHIFTGPRNTGLQYQLSSNPRLIYVPRRGDGELNTAGYRGKVWSYDRTPGRKRILFIGDSVVEGVGTTKVEERFTNLLEEKFGNQVDLVNLGVRGYSIMQELEYLKDEGVKYAPDIVAVGVVYNDLHILSQELDYLKAALQRIGSEGTLYARYFDMRRDLDDFLLRFDTYRYLSLLGMRASSGSNDDRETFLDWAGKRIVDEDLRRIIADFKKLSAERRFKLIFFLLPRNAGVTMRDAQVIGDAARDAGIEVVDLDAPFREAVGGEGALGSYFKKGIDPCHLNPEGHRTVTDLIYPHMARLLQ